jgi:HK97 family phage prohead protease
MATPKTEKRSFQIRAAKENDFKIEGYAATFGTAADIGGMFKEVIAPGAFSRSLAAKADIHATVNHNFSQLLGRTTNGSLELEEDERGLRFSIQLDKNVAFHRDTYANVKSCLLNECSFIFSVEPSGEVWDAAGKTRTLTDVELCEVSIVALPAYPGTSADARSADSAALLTKVQDLPALWRQQERLQAINLAMIADRAAAGSQRSDTDDSDETTEEDFTAAQEALIEKYGRSANGHAPAHWLVDMDNSRCRTLHMDSQVRCSMGYSRDEGGDFDFDDVTPDCQSDYDTRAQVRLVYAMQEAKDAVLRQRMAWAAGRTK